MKKGAPGCGNGYRAKGCGSIHSSDEYLSQSEMEDNAIYSKLTSNGWYNNGIYALLANMQSESTLNPGIGEKSNSKTGFGLTQWTSYQGVDYYGDWADVNNLPRDNIDTQLARIQAEVDDPYLAPVQWGKN